MMPVKAGKLWKRIGLERPSNPQDASGQAVRNFTRIATVWASIEPLRGKLMFLAEKTTAEETHRVRIRYRSDLQNDWRISYSTPAGDRTFGIVSISDTEERHRELVLMCRELPLGEPV